MSDERVIVSGGTIVDPASGPPRPGDLVIDGERIAGIAPPGSVPAEGRVIDATGLLVLPGLVDMHVHLREPGHEYKETIATGTAAAVAGGITSVACMANTNPVNDSGAVTRFILEQAARAGAARVYPVGALSVGLEGARLAEFGEMRRAGIVAVSDDGRPVMDAGLMRRALEYARMFDLLVIAHEEDCGLAAGGVMNEGVTAVRLGLRGIPAAAEEVMVARDIALAELTGGRLHIAHISTRGAVELVRAAKARGVAVSAEATPHHLLLTEEAVGEYDTNAKMAPPLRTQADVDAVRAGLADGTIEALATDHAPHHRDEKEVEFEHAANGIVGLETSLALGLKLVAEGVLDLSTLVDRMSTGPARLLGVPGGTLRPGEAADVTLLDPKRTWVVDPTAFRSKSRNTPYAGWELTGKVVTVLVGGRTVYTDVTAQPVLRVAS
ncbi:MAG TPA: dihydroorotase [Candidatus Limnocylindria bacterium]|nr:dihydroorotase [Candidatus Limnocylindria bacterium]